MFSVRGVFNALSIKISLYDFFQVHLPREENGWEKCFLEIGTWTTSSHKIPSYVETMLKVLTLEETIQGSHHSAMKLPSRNSIFQMSKLWLILPVSSLHLCPNYTALFCELAFKDWLSLVLLNAFET